MTDNLTKALAEALRDADQQLNSAADCLEAGRRDEAYLHCTAKSVQRREALAAFDAAQQAVGEQTLSVVGPEFLRWENHRWELVSSPHGPVVPRAAQAAQPLPDECAATGRSCEYGPHGPKGEKQCRHCGNEPAAQPLPMREAFEAWCKSHGGLSTVEVGPGQHGAHALWPCTYYHYGTEIAWRAWANKPQALPVRDEREAPAAVAFSDKVVSTFLSLNGPAPDGVMDSLRLAAAHEFAALTQPAPEAQQAEYYGTLDDEFGFNRKGFYLNEAELVEKGLVLPLWVKPPAQAVPLSAEQIAAGYYAVPSPQRNYDYFAGGVAFAEQHHGIGVKLAGGGESTNG